jgi:hypothetical protein
MTIKLLPVLISLLLLCGNATAATKKRPCDPLTGDAVMAQAKALNKFKNRSQPPSLFDIDPTITIAKMLAPGNDTNRFPMTKAATIAGYVASVKVGGIETCNCHATDAAKRDTHIDVVADPKYAVQNFISVTTVKNGKRKTIKKDANEKYHLIVEVTPRVRDQQRSRGVDWSTDTLKAQLTHHWVRFTGWLLFDDEHIPEAENTHPGNKLNWRATCTEIHPIFAIEVVNPPSRFTNAESLRPSRQLN